MSIVDRADWNRLRGQLEDLFVRSFDRPIQAGYLDWRYADNGADELLFAVERAGDQLAASYSAFPVELVRNGVVYRTATSMTTMTHPDFRGKGLFPALANELYADGAARGLGLVWGFPNANSHPVFCSKLGWEDIHEIPTLTLDLTATAGATDPRVAMDDAFALRYPDAPHDGLIRVRRSGEYLRWRYARNPVNRYSNHVIARDGAVSAYAVTKVYGTALDLVDLQAPDPAEAKALLGHLAASACAGGLAAMSCWAPTHHAIHGVLERLGFTNGAPVTYFGARALAAAAAPEGWDNYKGWHVQMGDSDVY